MQGIILVRKVLDFTIRGQCVLLSTSEMLMQ